MHYLEHTKNPTQLSVNLGKIFYPTNTVIIKIIDYVNGTRSLSQVYEKLYGVFFVCSK
jgi:hypothetical protein